MDAGVRRQGALFNQPQYLAFKEQVVAMQGQLDALAVGGGGGGGGPGGWGTHGFQAQARRAVLQLGRARRAME